MVDLQKVKELNYAHHRSMSETPKTPEIYAMDDTSFRYLLKDVPRNLPLVLELGSAEGEQWKCLGEWGTRLVGIDLYEPFVTKSRSHGLAVYLGFIEDMSMFPDNHFDLVCSRHVMEHLGDVDRSIEEVKRILKPDGWTAHVTPDMMIDEELSHLNLFKAWEWGVRWAEHGFQILSLEKKSFHGGEVHLVAKPLVVA